MHHKINATLVLFALGLSALGPVIAADPDPSGTIVLTAADREGVALFGKAKIGKPTGKPEQVVAALGNMGQTVTQTVTVGTWGTDNPTDARVEFTPNIERAGAYDVYLYPLKIPFPGQTMTPIEVIHEGGHAALSLERHLGDVWAFLGTYPFAAGKHGKVVVDVKGTKQSLGIAGVKFVPVANAKTTLASRPKVLPVTTGVPDEFDKLRLQFSENATLAHDADLSDPLVRDKVVQEGAQAYYYWKTMARGEGLQDLWTDVPAGKPVAKNEGGGWTLQYQFKRLYSMAQAYAGSNAQLGFASKMQGNPELLKDILWGLNWFYENRYNERSINKLGAEWIAMEIIIPEYICKTILLIYPHVPPEFIRKEVASIEKICPGPDKMYGGGGVSTGYNRFHGVYAHALRAIVSKTPASLQGVDALIADEYRVNRRSDPMIRKDKPNYDGYYEDGSFIQHNAFPYIGIYGRGMLEKYGQLKALLQGSPWALNNPKSGIFNEWVYRGYAPLFFQGEIMYGSLGRSTGQSWHQNGSVSSEIMNAVAALAQSSGPAEQTRILSILKTWVVGKEKAPYPEFSQIKPERFQLDNLAVLARIKKDPAVPLSYPREGSWIFYNTDYVVHHQADFAVQLRMFSTRIRAYEDINGGTNKRGWYQGEGTLFLYNRDNSRYNDEFWATVNPYRLPGITVDTRSRDAEPSKDGPYSVSPWAGGVEVNGFGLASMGLMAVDSSLTARKAWFFFKDQIVCLGNEIKSHDGRSIETIVENVKLHGEGKNAFMVNGLAQPDTLGWQADLKDVKWAHLAGAVPGTDQGWVFPSGATLKAVREVRTGNWKEYFINDKDIVDHSRNYLTLWYDHGTNPVDASYAYVLLPGRTAQQTKSYADSPDIQILANGAGVQAVTCKALGVTGANFWEEAGGRAGRIMSSGKAAVLVHETPDTLTVGVADPTQLGKSVEISLDVRVTRVVKTEAGVTVVSLSPLKLAINLEKSDGKTFVAEFQR